jgi:hypothetical protein
VLKRSLYQLQTLKLPKPNPGRGALRPPVWLGSARAPFSPLWLPLPCSRKRRASAQLAPTCRHNKFPTATAFGDSLAASRRTNRQLGQIFTHALLGGDWRLNFKPDRLMVRPLCGPAMFVIMDDAASVRWPPTYLVRARRRALRRRRALFLRHAAQRQPPFSKKYFTYSRP